jgi:hypothetical protein
VALATMRRPGRSQAHGRRGRRVRQEVNDDRDVQRSRPHSTPRSMSGTSGKHVSEKPPVLLGDPVPREVFRPLNSLRLCVRV